MVSQVIHIKVVSIFSPVKEEGIRSPNPQFISSCYVLAGKLFLFSSTQLQGLCLGERSFIMLPRRMKSWNHKSQFAQGSRTRLWRQSQPLIKSGAKWETWIAFMGACALGFRFFRLVIKTSSILNIYWISGYWIGLKVITTYTCVNHAIRLEMHSRKKKKVKKLSTWKRKK